MHFDLLLNKGVFMDIEKDEKLEVDSKAISGMISGLYLVLDSLAVVFVEVSTSSHSSSSCRDEEG